MLLNITTTHNPATDLGYLLHKHPDKFQTFDLSVGKAHVFYPEKGEEKRRLVYCSILTRLIWCEIRVIWVATVLLWGIMSTTDLMWLRRL